MFLNTGPKDVEILAFIDNDTRKQGGDIQGIPIHSPEHIVRCKAEVIYVASCAQKEIVEQLTHHLGLPESMIHVVSLDDVKSTLDPTDVASLRGDLRQLVQAFREANIPWWLDHGSLLHFVRSGEFISEHDDIDLCILAEHATAAQQLIPQLFRNRDILFKHLDEKWPSPYWNPGDIERIKIGKGLDIQIKYCQEDSVYWLVTPYVLQASKLFYQDAEERLYFDIPLRLPKDTVAYLSNLYGASWEQPQPGWTFADYGNIVSRYRFFS